MRTANVIVKGPVRIGKSFHELYYSFMIAWTINKKEVPLAYKFVRFIWNYLLLNGNGMYSSNFALNILAVFFYFVYPYIQTLEKRNWNTWANKKCWFSDKKYRNRKEESFDSAVESDNVDEKLVSKPIRSNNCLKIYQC